MDNSWNPTDLKVRNLECLYTMLFYDRFNKKIENSNEKSIKMDNVDSIEVVINSEIKSRNRHSLIKMVLNDNN